MKHKLFLCVVAVLISATTFAQFSGSGSGTQSDPYLITNAMQLDQVRNYLSQDVYFKLMEDIDLQEFIAENYPTQGWLPIGNSTHFTGNFDGNGKTISNLIINRPSTDYVGLFGKISCGSSISNLHVEGAVVGHQYAGGVVGYAKGVCTDSCCSMINVSFKGEIKGTDDVGGLAGSFEQNENRRHIINNCLVEAIITGNNRVGGLIGHCVTAEISKSIAIVTIHAQNYCGGIVGQLPLSSYTYANVSTCYVYGNIYAQKCVGGIIGVWTGTNGISNSFLQNCYFSGSLNAQENVGGICGQSSSGGLLNNYANAYISGVSNVGGIVGLGKSTFVRQNVAINSIVSGINNVGRIYGSATGSIGGVGTSNANKSLNTTIVSVNGVEQVCEDDEQHGQGIGKSLVKYKATYQGIGWDFADIWDMQEAESYPYFKWQVAPPLLNNATSSAISVSGTGINGSTIHLIIKGQSYLTACNSNVWSITTSPLMAGDTIYAYATMEDKSASYIVSAIVAQTPITSLHLSDDASTFATGFYEGGIDYTRSIGTTDEYVSFCFPFNVKQNENVSSIEELYIPLGIALKYADANNEDILKVLFVATDEVEAGTPFIAKLANAHSTNLSIVSATNEITQGVEAASTNIIPYIYDASAVGSNAAVPTNGNISWCGTFEDLSNQTFYALQADGGFIYQLNANTNPFRGYLSVTNMPTIKKVIAFVDAQGDATSIEHMFGQDSYAPQKILRNGQIVILRGNKTYTITGAEVK